MAVVVTGASGFVGRSLCRALAGRGHAVRAVLRPGVPAPGPGIDRAEIDDLRNAARAHQIDETGADAAKIAAEINSDLTRDFAAAARTAGAGRVVFLSSAGAQEAERRLAAGESLEAMWLERPYQTSKLAAERALEGFERGGYAVVILRAPLVYGPDAPGNFRQLRRLMERGMRLLGRARSAESLLGDLVLDSTPLREALGWRPRWTLVEGLAESVRG